MNSKKLIERLNELQKENRELKANCAIQEHIIKNRHNPMDIEKLQRLILENAELREELKSKGKLISQQAKELERRHTLLQKQEAELERVKTERDSLRCFFEDISSRLTAEEIEMLEGME